MTIGEHEPVAVGPCRIGGIVAQRAIPQDLGNIGHAHGGTRVATVGRLHRIHREYTNGVGQIKLRGHGSSGIARRAVLSMKHGS